MGIVTWMQDAIIWSAWICCLRPGEFGIELLRGSAFIAPDVTVLPAVQRFSETSLWIVNVSYVIAVIAAGATAMTYENIQIRYGTRTFCRAWSPADAVCVRAAAVPRADRAGQRADDGADRRRRQPGRGWSSSSASS